MRGIFLKKSMGLVVMGALLLSAGARPQNAPQFSPKVRSLLEALTLDEKLALTQGGRDPAYLGQAGYVVVSYTPRGFWNSGGEIDTTGPNDVADARARKSFVRGGRYVLSEKDANIVGKRIRHNRR